MSKAMLSKEQQDRILQKLKQVERNIDIEIVPMIVSCSSVVRHVALILFFLISGLFIFADVKSQIWLSPLQEILVFIVGIIIAYFLSSLLARIVWIQRLFTSDYDEEFQVNNRAELEFYRGRYSSLEKRNVALLFVSLMEKRSAIFSDLSVKNNLTEGQAEEIKEALSSGLKQSKVDLGFIEAMSLLESYLKDKIPADPSKKNQVTDSILIKD